MNAAERRRRLKEMHWRLLDASRVLDLPEANVGARDEGETSASSHFKVGYAKSAIKGVLEELLAVQS